MGLTWIVGVLVIQVDALLPLAYIFTVMSAFQGLWIFVIFVLLPKQVRDEYSKLWKAKKRSLDLSKYWLDSSRETRVVVSNLKV